MTPTTVADVVADAIARSGTPRLFGVAGGQEHPVLVAARQRGLPIVLAHTVAAACTMAAVTADLTDAPGVVALDAAAAPAALSALARCWIDRSPVILVTRPAAQPALGAELLGPVTKAVIPLAAESAGGWIAHAVHLALAAPRGPVNLELSADVAASPALAAATSLRPAPPPPPEARVLDEAARLLSSASRPVAVVGVLARSHDAAGWLRAFAEAMPAPVLSSPRAKGVLPDPHPLALGLLDGGPVADTLLARADLIVAVGLDSAEAALRAWDPAKAVLHLGASAADDGPYRPRVEVVGDIGLILEELAPRLRERARADWDVAEVDRLKRALVGSKPRAAAGGRLEWIVSLAREATPPGTIAAADGALRDVSARAWQSIAPGEFLTPNDPLAAGFALPAALAGHLVHPERRALCFTDAAGLMASLAELETAARLGLGVIVIVATEDSPKVEALAQALGAIGLAARGEAALGWALERALGTKGTVVIAVRP